MKDPLLLLLRGGIIVSILVSLGLIPVVCSTADETLVVCLGVACLAVVSVPVFLRRDYDLFEPLTFVILLVIFGTPFKLLYIIAVQYENEFVLRQLLIWNSPDTFVQPLVFMLIGWVFFVAGYSLHTPTRLTEMLFLPAINTWNQSRLAQFLLVVLGLSLVMLVIFMVSAGIGPGNLSAKRFVTEGGSGGRIHEVTYYLYRGAALCKFVTYFSLAWMLCRRDRITSLTGGMLAISLAMSVFLAFILNNRAGVVLVLLDCLVIGYYLGGKIRLRSVALTAACGLLLLIPMLISRSTAETSVASALEKTLTGRDLLDITKTCHIINGVPEKMDFRYGETLYGWIFAPVPTSLWPDKPMWADRGPYILRNIFGSKYSFSGLPPGLAAELYWNFGMFGLWFGLGLLGWTLRLLHRSFTPYRTNPTSVLMYTIIVTRFGIFALGNDLGTGILKTALDLVPLGAIALFVGGTASTDESDEATTLNEGSSAP